MVYVGSNITQQRIRKGLTQAQLAMRCIIPQPNLSNIEKGKQDLTVSTLFRIASALEVSPGELIREPLTKDSPELTRRNIEAIARAVVNPKARVSPPVKQIAGLIRVLLPETNPRGSVRKTQEAWRELKSRFSSQQIQGICQRVQDALQRSS